MIKPLNSVALPDPDGTNSLTKQLYETVNPRGSSGGVTMYSISPLEPFWFPSNPVGEALDKPNHLVWVSEDLPAVSYNSLDNANKLTNGEMVKAILAGRKTQTRRVLKQPKRKDGAMFSLDLSRDEKTAIVANGLSDDITVIDMTTMQPVQSLPIGRVPHTVVIDD